ncbi:bifunctional aminoglycoside phosphotransferase/ATP-binding protein [Variovorax sp. JS1663]|uniref:bifunctional aminoglycoside phosphotransferase/ATP-binding protein n=1 Tax=Variovorax sp. JS1663 TaxID=1851577 RepID=UPI000B346B36|nr:bifunctional aminoglycoside phosphotransferase/ATP-binding protein [Variovorax sp. JS1663]OUM00928.1 aminoglycoside phosphotransferase [Variovorax sp. JS1663]
MNLQPSPEVELGRRRVEALRERLRCDTGEPVTLIETHISWVLLTQRTAYKLKKPVSLGFVDFRALDARRRFCEEEVRLNRRLAPMLYEGVLPVRGTNEAPRLGGGGVPVDFAVCMRRFPEEALLSRLLAADRPGERLIEQFGHGLAMFHEHAAVAAQESAFGDPRLAGHPAIDALARLRMSGGARVPATLQAWVFEQERALRTAWAARKRDGRVRECHGDLHLSNLVLLDGSLTAFDCIEFDPALRWIDVMSDVAFLTMDLKAHGRPDLAWRFLDAYLQQGGDYAGLPVLRFYEVYRALVRALVSRLRAAAAPVEASPPGEPDHLTLASRLAQDTDGAPRLLITHGLSGSGKSTVAASLVAATGSIRIRSDVERKRLFGLSALERSGDRNAEVYSEDATQRTFARVAQCARLALYAGYPVIVDAAFLRREERMAFHALAAELRVSFAILSCRATEAQLRRRVAARALHGNDASEATVAVLERQLATHEPLAQDERAFTLEVATDQPVDVSLLATRWLGRQR